MWNAHTNMADTYEISLQICLISMEYIYKYYYKMTDAINMTVKVKYLTKLMIAFAAHL